MDLGKTALRKLDNNFGSKTKIFISINALFYFSYEWHLRTTIYRYGLRILSFAQAN